MTESSRILIGVSIGACLGGVAAHLFFTSRGRQRLAQLNPRLDELSHDLKEVRRAIGSASDAVHEARGVMEDLRSLSRRDLAEV